jgi:hypothetical protein
MNDRLKNIVEILEAHIKIEYFNMLYKHVKNSTETVNDVIALTLSTFISAMANSLMIITEDHHPQYRQDVIKSLDDLQEFLKNMHGVKSDEFEVEHFKSESLQ